MASSQPVMSTLCFKNDLKDASFSDSMCCSVYPRIFLHFPVTSSIFSTILATGNAGSSIVVPEERYRSAATCLCILSVTPCAPAFAILAELAVLPYCTLQIFEQKYHGPSAFLFPSSVLLSGQPDCRFTARTDTLAPRDAAAAAAAAPPPPDKMTVPS